MRITPIAAIGASAVLLLGVNEAFILDATALAYGGTGFMSRMHGTQFFGGAARADASGPSSVTALILRTGVPDRYGAELGVTFPNPADQQAMNAMMAAMSKFDPGYGSEKIALGPELKTRYTNIGLRISCEYCCGAKSIVFPNGEAACGCAHSQAMRGLTAYLLQNHANEYTDDEILRELAAWKGLYFPKQMAQKVTAQLASGQYTPDIAALLLGMSPEQLKTLGGTGAAALPSAIDQLPQMSGGC